MIGTLNEGPLHQALKRHYLQLDPGGRAEVPVDGFVADVLHGGMIYEVQTGGFSTLRRKLRRLIQAHPVVLIYPVATTSYLVKRPGKGPRGKPSRRRSPKHGSLLSLLDELVSIPALLDHPNFEVEVALIEEEQIREYCDRKRRGLGGWRTVERRLLALTATQRFRSVADLWMLAPGDLPTPFSTADLGAAMGATRDAGQKLAYCLRTAGAIAQTGKSGNSLLYQRCTALPQPADPVPYPASDRRANRLEKGHATRQ